MGAVDHSEGGEVSEVLPVFNRAKPGFGVDRAISVTDVSRIDSRRAFFARRDALNRFTGDPLLDYPSDSAGNVK